MNWYEMLNEYFPKDELKTRQHIETLLADNEYYYLDCSNQHVMLYTEHPNFIFIDYLYVRNSNRQKGLGKQLIHKLKQRGKTIILEAEALDASDPDTEKRLRFYKRESFQKASNIHYVKQSLNTGEHVELDVLYWDDHGIEDNNSIYSKMVQIYKDIHTYKEFKLYHDYHPNVHDAIQLVSSYNVPST